MLEPFIFGQMGGDNDPTRDSIKYALRKLPVFVKIREGTVPIFGEVFLRVDLDEEKRSGSYYSYDLRPLTTSNRPVDLEFQIDNLRKFPGVEISAANSRYLRCAVREEKRVLSFNLYYT